MSQLAAIGRVGILGFGAMGAGVAESLRRSGKTVATCVEGRSDATRDRARLSGVETHQNLQDLIANCDTFLSLVPADQAEPLAAGVAECLKAQARPVPLHYVDANSITRAGPSALHKQLRLPVRSSPTVA